MKVAIVVAPHNHGALLRASAARLAEFGLPVLIVDDSDDEAAKRTITEVAALHRMTVVTPARNGGQGHAVAAGLRAAAQLGFTHAVQVDSDGPHDLADLPKLLGAARANPTALICGDPQLGDPVPRNRTFAHKLTAFLVAIETLSLRMPDTTCTFRIYPLAATIALLDSVRLGDGTDFDIEIVVRLHWRNVQLVAVPTSAHRSSDGSNPRSFSARALIAKLHAKLLFGMLLRLPLRVTRRFGAALHWADLGERSEVVGVRLLFAVYRFFGRRAFTMLLYPVVGYFCVTAGSARRASRDYLCAVRSRLAELGRPMPPGLTLFQHELAFGNGVLDKLAMWADAMPPRAIPAEDFAMLERFSLESRGGALFIGSHLGNLEMLRAVGNFGRLKVNPLVFTRHLPKFNQVLQTVSPKTLERMIQVDSLGPDAVNMLRDKLAAGEHVAIVGDRVSVRHQERSLRVPFLGRPAPFPEGPFVLASLLECPVYLLFCVKVDGQYRVFLEPFADPLVLPRVGRQQALERAIERYAARLEAHCLLAPTQWFNFFDFWGQAGGR